MHIYSSIYIFIFRKLLQCEQSFFLTIGSMHNKRFKLPFVYLDELSGKQDLEPKLFNEDNKLILVNKNKDVFIAIYHANLTGDANNLAIVEFLQRTEKPDVYKRKEGRRKLNVISMFEILGYVDHSVINENNIKINTNTGFRY